MSWSTSLCHGFRKEPQTPASTLLAVSSKHASKVCGDSPPVSGAGVKVENMDRRSDADTTCQELPISPMQIRRLLKLKGQRSAP